MKSKLTKKRLILGLIIIVLATIALGWKITDGFSRSQPDTDGSSGINYEPPTEEEIKQAEDHKEALRRRQDQEANPPANSGLKTVTPFISSWGQDPDSKALLVNGYIADVYEAEGVCTVKATLGSTTVTADGKGVKDVNRTSCSGISIARSQLSPGEWQVALSYSSDNAQGSSKPVMVTVK